MDKEVREKLITELAKLKNEKRLHENGVCACTSVRNCKNELDGIYAHIRVIVRRLNNDQ